MLKMFRFKHRTSSKWLGLSVRPIRSKRPDEKMDSTDPDTGLLFVTHILNVC
jgi:hypothetical protein